ncbi:MAG: hypothetical protein KDD14_22200 [Saprospiraceae bacterium]|nr:hypothetical protein [Saprospiraceae bacterium]
MKTKYSTAVLQNRPVDPLEDFSMLQQPFFEQIDRETIGITDSPVVVKSIHLAAQHGRRYPKLGTRAEYPDQQLMHFEADIRRYAYGRMFKEAFDPSFFDDSDMHAPYYLHIVYDRELGTPIASARSFSCPDDMITELEGTDGGILKMNLFTHQTEKIAATAVLCPDVKSNFMVDRFSQIVEGHDYRGIPKSAIFGLLYRSFFITYQGYQYVLALARVDASSILLAKYIPLGLQIIGITNYKVGETFRKHWVLAGNIPRIRQELLGNCRLLLSIYK